MNPKYLVSAFLFTAVVACNNEAPVQDKTDSVTQTNDNWPGTQNMTGKDSVPSPETQADTSGSVPRKQ